MLTSIRVCAPPAQIEDVPTGELDQKQSAFVLQEFPLENSKVRAAGVAFDASPSPRLLQHGLMPPPPLSRVPPQCWFFRFCLDVRGRFMALGDTQGQVWVWEVRSPLSTRRPSPLALLNSILPGPRPAGKVAIRAVAFSHDGKTIVAARDDGSIVRWDAPVLPPTDMEA